MELDHVIVFVAAGVGRHGQLRAGFQPHPQVIDGCSRLLADVLGDAGAGARSAVGIAELPFDIAVEIEAVVQIR